MMQYTLSAKSDTLFKVFNYSILVIVLIIILYPLYFIVIASISDPTYVNMGQVLFIPRGITFLGYENVFSFDQIWMGYRNTIFYTLAGTTLNVIVTMMFAYPLSRKIFSGKRILMVFLLITMYFNGGLIPTYLLVRSLGLYDNVLAIVILGAINAMNVIITRTYLQTNIPDEVYESAVIDGCSHFTFLWRIVMPLSKAILAVLALYYGINHWNDFFNALIYLSDNNKMPLQIILRNILVQNQIMLGQLDVTGIEDELKRQKTVEIMKYSLIIIASIPVLAVYPFMQKYFVQGVMIGSIKG